MSFCATAIVAAKSAVNAPMNATIVIVFGSRLMSGNMRMTVYTPAETIVAAWIIALTGVGPSIASGSQTCSGNCADLPIVPMKSSKPIKPAAEKPEETAWHCRKCMQHFFGEDLAEGKCPGCGVKICNTEQHEHIADACGHECLDGCIACGRFRVPETDQEIRTQAHDLPTDEERQQVIGKHQHIHAKGEQADEGKEA